MRCKSCEKHWCFLPDAALGGMGGLRYSTGKTSLIKWVTGIESPFFDIRPQPSTDKFMAVVHGDEERAESNAMSVVRRAEPFAIFFTSSVRFACGRRR